MCHVYSIFDGVVEAFREGKLVQNLIAVAAQQKFSESETCLM